MNRALWSFLLYFLRLVFADFFWIFSERIGHFPLATAFLNCDSGFFQTHSQDTFAYCLAAMKTSYKISSEVSGGRTFFSDNFLATTIENPVFPESKCSFVALLWPKIPCMGFQCQLGDGSCCVGTWCVGGTQVLADIFGFFSQDFGWKLSKKNKIFE